jgi:hypothetical protein
MRFTGEPDDIERVTSGSEGGSWKSAGIHWIHGNSLAASPTVGRLQRLVGRTPPALFGPYASSL